MYRQLTAEQVHGNSKSQAEKDLEQGLLGMRTFGLIRSPHLLVQAYEEAGVRLQIIAGDVIDQYVEADADGYNGVMLPEIIKRHGESFFETVRNRHKELRATAR